MQKLSALFYMDDGILASPRLARLKEALDFLAKLFDRMKLCMNVEKTVGMVCQSCRTTYSQLEEAYTFRMTR